MERRKLVDSMSFEDIWELYKQEIPFVDHKNEEYTKKHMRLIRPFSKAMTFFSPITFKRNSGLNIVFQYLDKGANHPMSKRLGLIFYFWCVYRGEVWCVRPILFKDLGFVCYFYSGHFIERYRERKLGDMNISKPDAINIFLRNNMRRLFKNVPSEKYGDNCWICSSEGISFAEVRPNAFTIMKTFLSWEYLCDHKRNMSLDMIEEAHRKGIEFKMPDELIDEEDLA